MSLKINPLQNIPNPNTQSPKEFEDNTTLFLNERLPAFVSEANSLGDDLTSKWNNVKNWHNDVYSWRGDISGWRSETLNARNEAYGYKNAAESAWNNIQNYTLANSATYTQVSLDAMFDEVIRVQTAQQIVLNLILN